MNEFREYIKEIYDTSNAYFHLDYTDEYTSYMQALFVADVLRDKNCKWETFIFRCNESSEGIRVVADALLENDRIISIDFRYSCLDNENIKTIINVLKINKRIRRFNFWFLDIENKLSKETFFNIRDLQKLRPELDLIDEDEDFIYFKDSFGCSSYFEWKISSNYFYNLVIIRLNIPNDLKI